MNWSDIVGSTISGVITAATLALFALGYNQWRRWWIRRDLKRAFTPKGCGRSDEDFSLLIQNDSAVPVAVRGVAVVVEEPWFRVFLDFLGPERPLSAEMSGGFNVPEIGPREPDEYGLIHLPPGTAARWGLTIQDIRESLALSSPVVGCDVHFEYRTILGRREAVIVNAPDAMVQQVRELIRDMGGHREAVGTT